MVERAYLERVRRWFAPPFLGILAATACSNDFDASRNVPSRGTLGAELFGVVCDRMGAQSLHEDLSGASYRAICHGENGDSAFGPLSSRVDQTALPAVTGDLPGVNGGVITMAQQQADRIYGVGRMERLAADRARLIAALDATFPVIDVPIKDIGAADPTQSCQPAPTGQGSLHTELANLLNRFTALYDDGTIPASTEALAAVTTVLHQSADSQASWAHFNSRAGYRPFDLALGAARPLIAYRNLRAFVDATLALLSPDSNPYDPAAKKDAHGNRIPVPGAAYAEMSRLSAALHADLANETADPAPSPLVLAKALDPTTGATVLNRPMTDLETIQSILFAAGPGLRQRSVRDRDGHRQRAELHRPARPARLCGRGAGEGGPAGALRARRRRPAGDRQRRALQAQRWAGGADSVRARPRGHAVARRLRTRPQRRRSSPSTSTSTRASRTSPRSSGTSGGWSTALRCSTPSRRTTTRPFSARSRARTSSSVRAPARRGPMPTTRRSRTAATRPSGRPWAI